MQNSVAKYSVAWWRGLAHTPAPGFSGSEFGRRVDGPVRGLLCRSWPSWHTDKLTVQKLTVSVTVKGQVVDCGMIFATFDKLTANPDFLLCVRTRMRACANISVCHIVSLSVFIYIIIISITYHSDTTLTGFDSGKVLAFGLDGFQHCLSGVVVLMRRFWWTV